MGKTKILWSFVRYNIDICHVNTVGNERQKKMLNFYEIHFECPSVVWNRVVVIIMNL